MVDYLHHHIENAEIEIKDLAYKGAYKIYGTLLPLEVQKRLDKELKSIIENNFATLYMIAQKLVKKSNPIQWENITKR